MREPSVEISMSVDADGVRWTMAPVGSASEVKELLARAADALASVADDDIEVVTAALAAGETLPAPGDPWSEADEATSQRQRVLDRIHIIEGLLAVSHRWSDISALVSGSSDRRQASEKLEAFGFSAPQAQHALDFSLGRRTEAAVADVEEELHQLRDALRDP